MGVAAGGARCPPVIRQVLVAGEACTAVHTRVFLGLEAELWGLVWGGCLREGDGGRSCSRDQIKTNTRGRVGGRSWSHETKYNDMKK